MAELRDRNPGGITLTVDRRSHLWPEVVVALGFFTESRSDSHESLSTPLASPRIHS